MTSAGLINPGDIAKQELNVPLDTVKDYAGAIVTAAIAILAAFWGFLVMLFTMKNEVSRAHTRIDILDRKIDASHEQLLHALEVHESRNLERDTRIEDKLDRLIERRE